MCVCMHMRLDFCEVLDQSTGFLKRYLCLNPLLHPHVASHHENTRLFKKKSFSIAFFFFTADKVMSFQNKIFYYGFSNGATTKPTSLTAPGFPFGEGKKVEDSQVDISIASSISL